VSALGDLVGDMDAVIHNAALIPAMAKEVTHAWEAFFEVNALGTYRMLEIAKRVRCFVYISGTALIQGDNLPITEESRYSPGSDYLSSKIAGELACEQFVRTEKMRVATLRFPAPYGYVGMAGAVIPRFVAAAKAGEDLTLWGSGGREQVFTFVEDVGLACELAIRANTTGVFNVAGVESISMKGLAETVLRTYPESGSRIVFADQPDPLEGQRATVSIAKARRELGFEPRYTLEAGLRRIRDADKGAEVRFFGQPAREMAKGGV
jgi:nucleoside-diphosphate-sugar epimerase